MDLQTSNQLWENHGKPCQIMSDMVCLPIFAQTNSRTLRFGEVGSNLPKNGQRVSQVTNSHHFFLKYQPLPILDALYQQISLPCCLVLLGFYHSLFIPNEKNASRSTSCCGSKLQTD